MSAYLLLRQFRWRGEDSIQLVYSLRRHSIWKETRYRSHWQTLQRFVWSLTRNVKQAKARMVSSIKVIGVITRWPSRRLSWLKLNNALNSLLRVRLRHISSTWAFMSNGYLSPVFFSHSHAQTPPSRTHKRNTLNFTFRLLILCCAPNSLTWWRSMVFVFTKVSNVTLLWNTWLAL